MQEKAKRERKSKKERKKIRKKQHREIFLIKLSRDIFATRAKLNCAMTELICAQVFIVCTYIVYIYIFIFTIYIYIYIKCVFEIDARKGGGMSNGRQLHCFRFPRKRNACRNTRMARSLRTRSAEATENCFLMSSSFSIYPRSR